MILNIVFLYLKISVLLQKFIKLLIKYTVNLNALTWRVAIKDPDQSIILGIKLDECLHLYPKALRVSSSWSQLAVSFESKARKMPIKFQQIVKQIVNQYFKWCDITSSQDLLFPLCPPKIKRWLLPKFN